MPGADAAGPERSQLHPGRENQAQELPRGKKESFVWGFFWFFFNGAKWDNWGNRRFGETLAAPVGAGQPPALDHSGTLSKISRNGDSSLSPGCTQSLSHLFSHTLASKPFPLAEKLCVPSSLSPFLAAEAPLHPCFPEPAGISVPGGARSCFPGSWHP